MIPAMAKRTLGQALAFQRWKGVTKKERAAHVAMMNEARAQKLKAQRKHRDSTH